jgi:carbon storage regulator
MLVLTRKSNQAIVIGDDIEVSVLAVVGDKVRVGIEAPRSVPVYRKEVWLENQREGPRASGETADSAEVDRPLERLKGGK